MARALEYRIVKFYTDAARGLMVATVNNARVAAIGKTGVSAATIDLPEYLNSAGREGWDVVTVMGNGSEGHIMMKREAGGLPLIAVLFCRTR